MLCANIIYEKYLTLKALMRMDDLKVRLASFGPRNGMSTKDKEVATDVVTS